MTFRDGGKDRERNEFPVVSNRAIFRVGVTVLPLNCGRWLRRRWRDPASQFRPGPAGTGSAEGGAEGDTVTRIGRCLLTARAAAPGRALPSAGQHAGLA